MRRKINYNGRLKRDLFWVGVSIVFAIFLIKLGVLEEFLAATSGVKILASFIAGIFFTSVFTIAPASIALAELATSTNIYMVAFYGALGAMLGDLIIFFFIRDVFAVDLNGALMHSRFKKFARYLHLGFMRWAAPLLGALIIASPLPDELGLSLMGAAHMKTRYLIPVSFAFNFIGVLIIAFIARSL
ncbi:MAG: hypothetical protein A2928_03100 [Candidatus Taylorbacteria bacterium RIFCSPLOWO2_01_FULL_45_15b]|uniref:TVP38/TMEM64 family membrane protein n=1 Tax=Candidatus Taylorbacteria bacterium RIFCSPLOWO2_01_FULL_45_15b TaxID=1802319 RepID=A0A1G2NAJ0_9BACT|nr:MAG: hypothetical protein A2928_03100 [Candidatus Taylorbacteria bacterium RIFCSPLOWO2_01_FULL_45_15b]